MRKNCGEDRRRRNDKSSEEEQRQSGTRSEVTTRYGEGRSVQAGIESKKTQRGVKGEELQ